MKSFIFSTASIQQKKLQESVQIWLIIWSVSVLNPDQLRKLMKQINEHFFDRPSEPAKFLCHMHVHCFQLFKQLNDN